MKKNILLSICLVSAAILVAFLAPSLAQAETIPEQSHIVTGTIINVDLMGSKITLQRSDPYGSKEEITLQIVGRTIISEGDLRRELNDLRVDDEIVVQYTDAPLNKTEPQATLINIKPPL